MFGDARKASGLLVEDGFFFHLKTVLEAQIEQGGKKVLKGDYAVEL